MRNLPSSLQRHLDGGATTLCWCWKLTNANGRTLGFTDHDEDVTIDGTICEASSGFTASEIEGSLGLSVDNLEVEGALRSARLNEADLRSGLFDSAGVEIWLVNWSEPDQRLLLRKGTFGEVTRSDLAFTVEVRGLMQALNQAQGRVFQYGCDASLGDARCAADLSAAGFKGSGTVCQTESNRRFIVSGLEDFSSGWFSRGGLEWTSGENRAAVAEVQAHRLEGSKCAIELWQPAAFPIAAGDAFTLTAGCDKQFTTCCNKFANAANYRGFPHMPGNDFVVSYATAGDSAK